jgi:hypothetical protein
MTASGELTHESGARCWCCGQAFPDSELLHLGSSPQVAVCFRCARLLAQRARRAQDADSPSPGARFRGVVDQGRDFVVEHGLQRLPVLGPALRWLGDRLP